MRKVVVNLVKVNFGGSMVGGNDTALLDEGKCIRLCVLSGTEY